jgi:hypothetical protein
MQESPQLANVPGEAQLTWLINSMETKNMKEGKDFRLFHTICFYTIHHEVDGPNIHGVKTQSSNKTELLG